MDLEGDRGVRFPFRRRQTHLGGSIGRPKDLADRQQKFIGDFVKHVRGAEGSKPKAFCVGEFWKDSVDTLVAYVEGLGTQFSCFDSCLQANFKEAGEAKENYDLRKIFDNTLVQRRPIDAVTLVDNHDTQVGQSLERWVSSGFKPLAYALILLRVDGYP